MIFAHCSPLWLRPSPYSAAGSAFVQLKCIRTFATTTHSWRGDATVTNPVACAHLLPAIFHRPDRARHADPTGTVHDWSNRWWRPDRARSALRTCSCAPATSGCIARSDRFEMGTLWILNRTECPAKSCSIWRELSVRTCRRNRTIRRIGNWFEQSENAGRRESVDCEIVLTFFRLTAGDVCPADFHHFV